MRRSARLPDAELAEFERLIDAVDRDLFAWITGEAETPAEYDTALFRRMKAFHTHASPIHT